MTLKFLYNNNEIVFFVFVFIKALDTAEKSFFIEIAIESEREKKD